MAATQVLDERNGTDPGVRQDNVGNCNFGSNDSYEIVVATYPVTIGNNSFEKWWKIEFGGTFNTIDNLKIWKVSGDYKAGESILTNAREATYGGEETYTTPTESNSLVATEVLPITEPSGPNLGIGGSLGGNLAAPGDSDYLIEQLKSTGSTPVGDGNTKVMRFQHDES